MTEIEKKAKRAGTLNKEVNKQKKHVKERDREIAKLK